MINVHASLLPRYRGAAPIQRAVLAGDAETGVTIMRVVTELDAGPMFAIGAVPIPPDATSGEMERALAQLGARAAARRSSTRWPAGRAVETPQDHARRRYAPKITKDEGAIDWTAPAAVIHNQVRGLQPWPLASTRLGGDAAFSSARTVPSTGETRLPAQAGHRSCARDGRRARRRRRRRTRRCASSRSSPKGGAR